MSSFFDDKKEPDEITQTPTNTSAKSLSTGDFEKLEKLEILPHILQEGILFAGSGSALLLQAAYPGIKNRISDSQNAQQDSSSALAKELSDALQATLSYIACLVLGTEKEKKTLLDLLQRGQHPIRASETYTSHPPTQLWVSATLYATATDFYQRIYGRVNYRTAEKAYAEFTLLMHALGMPTGTWPATRQAFWKYWDDQIEQLSVTADAHRFAKDLFDRTDLPRWVVMLKPLMRVATIEMLPPRIREAYGLKSTASTRGLYRTAMGFSVAIYPALPKSTRSYALQYYLEDLRKHLNVRIGIIDQALQLVDILARQQLLKILGRVAAQEHRAAFDDSLQIFQRVLAEELLQAVDQLRQLREKTTGGLRSWCGHGVGVGDGQGGSKNEVLEETHFEDD
ncbi:hypothetical protein P170DRAFT_348880 [Aspergillus steynii IBT 23096]|uniref:ER-bound oxygenase mpaB/mpaB'/Rubber oxygenase catalytic domain-containing protein n=1 Tax=Aspergillus steynii IBT 23096 TaxID=1392250 RepID=A0A2I2GKL4_9EURO|nr:uncharacterized protein P170DRAFT_348880 [Aspergillus steynii IBT 23096]PLB53420.1 hypothetical protein P170DRAFT_348880 [Aspergillus steynii IBT 23096]